MLAIISIWDCFFSFVLHVLHALHVFAARCVIYSKESIVFPLYIHGMEALITARTSFMDSLNAISSVKHSVFTRICFSEFTLIILGAVDSCYNKVNTEFFEFEFDSRCI